ncbi:MAG: NAD(P)-dependent oxidoreductase [Trueperaceae bacterium]
MAPTPLRVLWRFFAPDPVPGPDLLPDGARLTVEPDLDRALAHRDEVDVLVDARPSELLDGAALSHVIFPFAGLPPALGAALRERPHLTLHNAHYGAPFVAQHALALLLAAAHHLVPHDAALRRGDWGDRRSPEPSVYLAEREALLLGYGAIGRQLAPMLQGLGMRVTALRRRPEADAAQAGVHVVGPDDLGDALARATVVVVSLPATAATEGLLGAAALARLPRGALVVNVGRGAVIDQDALYDALVDGRVGAAGLDVWWSYPEDRDHDRATLPATRPFGLLPNVVLSPHRAEATDRSERARVEDVCATLQAIAAGEARHVVEVGTGY